MLPLIMVYKHTLYMYTLVSSGGQMCSFCLNFIADFSSICSPLLFPSGSIEIGLLLRTPSIPENEMNRMHNIPLGRDVELRDLPSFLTNDIKSRKGKSFSCEITHHPGLSCFCSLRDIVTGKEYETHLAQHVFPYLSFFYFFFFSLSRIEDSLATADCVSTVFDDQAERLPLGHIEALNLYLQANSRNSCVIPL